MAGFWIPLSSPISQRFYKKNTAKTSLEYGCPFPFPPSNPFSKFVCSARALGVIHLFIRCEFAVTDDMFCAHCCVKWFEKNSFTVLRML